MDKKHTKARKFGPSLKHSWCHNDQNMRLCDSSHIKDYLYLGCGGRVGPCNNRSSESDLGQMLRMLLGNSFK